MRFGCRGLTEFLSRSSWDTSPKCIEQEALEEGLFKTLSIIYLEPAGEGKRRHGIIMHNIIVLTCNEKCDGEFSAWLINFSETGDWKKEIRLLC